MSFEVLHNAKVLQDNVTGELGIQCGCGASTIKVGNAWRDVTSDFTWNERIVPLYYAAMAGNKVIQLIAEIQLLEEVSEEIHLFDTTKWRAMTDSKFPIMCVTSAGLVKMIEASHWPGGYITADLTGVGLDDLLYVNIFVPVE